MILRARSVLRECAQLFQRELRQRGLKGLLARLPRYLRRALPVLAGMSGRAASAMLASPESVAPLRLHPELLDVDGQEGPCIAATISVLIPTLNAGTEFAHLMRKLRGQRGVRRIEIVVVDSGSTDGTVALARAAGAQVIEIVPADFSHSSARNLAAEAATGDHLLFMVQDAYPLGDLWAHGMLRYLLDHQASGLVALSCTEYCRDDSDMFYECGMATHYSYLGCKDDDRVGMLAGTDQESLRAMGQLSDVACLMRRDRFLQYRYRGHYAEDMDLGVRLIRDGHRIAMLASVKVIHSHRRASHYYLQRSFVDITFLSKLFVDFRVPACASARGMVLGARHVARQMAAWSDMLLENGASGAVHAAADRWLLALRQTPIDASAATQARRLNDERVDAFLVSLADDTERLPRHCDLATESRLNDQAAREFVDAFTARFDHFNRYAARGHPGEDALLIRQWIAAAAQTFAATLGFMLAALYLERQARADTDHKPDPDLTPERQWLERLAAQLTAGV